MKDARKPGFFKSLFGGARRTEPVRADLPLHIPVVAKTSLPAGLDINSLLNDLLQHDYAPLGLCTEIARLLEKLNPLPLSAEQREHCANILCNELNKGIGGLFIRFLDEGSGVPESREQRESLSQAVRAVEQLAIAYKLVFRHDYAWSNDEYPRRERVSVVVLRIMELIRLEQLLRAFRYQKLPQHAWRDCNQLYFAMLEFGGVQNKQVLKLHVSASEKDVRSALFSDNTSIEQVYLSIQITGLLDVISWPTHLMYVVDRYLAGLEPSLTTKADDDAGIPPGHIIIYQNQGQPPRFSRSQEELGSTLLVDVRPLVKRAAADRSALNSQGGEVRLGSPIVHLGDRDRIPVLDLLLHKVRPQQRSEPRRPVFDARDARVYGGFDEVYRLFRSVSQQASEASRLEQRLWDGLAQHAKIVMSEGDEASPRWIVSNESEGGVQLRVQESQYAMVLQMGRLVAYAFGDEGAAAAKLGYVVRLQRVGEREVEVAIARLRQTVRAVIVEDLDALEQRTLPAIMIRDPNGKLQLLCDNKHRFLTGDRLAVHANGQPYTGALGDPSLSKPDFTVFELHTAD